MEGIMEESKQVKRTRKFVSTALLSLLLEKNFEEISVTDICEKAMITRATFYKYFEDKYHLAQCVLIDLKEQIFDKELEKIKFRSTKELYLKLIELSYDYITLHEQNFVLFIKHSYTEKFRIMLLQTINDFVESITKKEHQNFRFQIPTELVSKFVTGGFAYTMLFMIENQTSYSKQDILKWTGEVLDAMIKD